MALKGERMGRFVLERLLDRGPGGESWRARDSAGGPPAAVTLFTQAAWAVAFRQSGPPSVPAQANLCRVVDSDTTASLPFLAIELAQGASLAEMLAAERFMPLSAAIPCLIQVVRGLAALHRDKRAHGDLRPENVVVDERGNARIPNVATDAFLKLALAEGASRGGAAWEARAPYFAPEVRKSGRTATLDPRADMYALGVLAYRALTGELPSSDFDLKYPSQKDKRIPKVLDEVILRCLERSPRARVPSALGLESELLLGLARGGFDVYPAGDPVCWIRATPWRAAGTPVGEDTGAFTGLMKKLAKEKE